ncbi:hypothetical protein GCM10008024_13640 [Allgaiera indica]|uniref:Uncharacterized protein n=1 Tax=Allgaiera indica TaxID=765699 RepID=A0AAN4ZZ95_9RHOB|nr:hypothetical protein GCM10008024_13640 [Allgaiera indica]SDW71116.1 hypothetical protein SAMN05444006_10655 [Allgaiera indica]
MAAGRGGGGAAPEAGAARGGPRPVQPPEYFRQDEKLCVAAVTDAAAVSTGDAGSRDRGACDSFVTLPGEPFKRALQPPKHSETSPYVRVPSPASCTSLR